MRSEARRTARMLAASTTGVAITNRLGPSPASGWPQQNSSASTTPRTGNAVNASAAFPGIVSFLCIPVPRRAPSGSSSGTRPQRPVRLRARAPRAKRSRATACFSRLRRDHGPHNSFPAEPVAGTARLPGKPAPGGCLITGVGTPQRLSRSAWLTRQSGPGGAMHPVRRPGYTVFATLATAYPGEREDVVWWAFSCRGAAGGR